MLKSAPIYRTKTISYNELGFELDNLQMDISALRHIISESFDRFPPVSTPDCDREAERTLHGGFERALELILDSLSEDLNILSAAAYNAAGIATA